MLTGKERLKKLESADTKTLARIDEVLTGNTDCLTVTYTAAARRLGCSRAMVYRLVKAGRLDAIAMSGTNRVLVSSINDFATGQRPADAATIANIERNTEKRTASAYIARKHKTERQAN